jgi:hypothetical protein
VAVSSGGLLDLGNTGIEDAGASSLPLVLVQCTALTRLDLGGNNVRCRGAVSLAQVLVMCTTLECLNLENNRIADEGAQNFARVLRQYPTLKRHYLEDDDFSAVGRRRLRANVAWEGQVVGIDEEFGVWEETDSD